MGSKSTPPTPNYQDLARQQGAADLATARTQGQLNNPNIYGPTGSRTVSFAGDQPTITEQLSPNQQYLMELQEGLQGQSLRALDQYGMPAVTQAMQAGYSLPGQAATDFDPRYAPDQGFSYGIDQSGVPGAQTSLDFSGAPGMPGSGEGARNQVVDALYRQGTGFLDPQFQRKHSQLDTKLSNQGIFGGEAYKGAQGDLTESERAAYGDLRDRAILAGGAEQSRLFADEMAARQQGVGEATQQGTFANQARGDIINQLLAQMGAGNAATTNAYNVAAQQAALQNAGRSQGFSEMSQRNLLPVNILTALMSNSQVQAPPSAQYNPTSINAPPIFQAGIAQGQADTANANARNAQMNNWLQAGARVAAGAATGGLSELGVAAARAMMAPKG